MNADVISAGKPWGDTGGTVYYFDCPGCGSPHMFVIGGGRGWTWNGDHKSPTVRPSILVNGNAKCVNPAAPRCHSYVTNGQIGFLNDSTHEKAGQTVPLPAWDRDWD